MSCHLHQEIGRDSLDDANHLVCSASLCNAVVSPSFVSHMDRFFSPSLVLGYGFEYQSPSASGISIHANRMGSTLPPENYDGYMLLVLGRDVASFHPEIIDQGI